MAIPKDAKTVFSFNLPYAIPIADGLYQVKLGKHLAGISTTRVQRKQVEGFEGSGTVQLRLDKYGKSSFSHIDLTLPWIVDFQERGRKPLLLGDIPPRNKAKEIALRFLNRFIETVRYSTEEYWVASARYQDIMAYEAFYWDGKNKYPAMLVLLDTGVGGIGVGTGHPFQTEQKKIQEIKRILENEEELDSDKIFILNSKDACLQEDFRLAIIEAVAALEIVLYQFIRLQGEKLQVPKDELKGFIVDVGLTGNISVVLKMLTKGLKQIDDDTIGKCKGAIKIRNRILHEGFREITSTDTEERIIAIEKMIEYLKALIAIV
jgi:hypothetical protein